MSRNLTITKTGKQTIHGHAHRWLHLDSKGGTQQFRIQNQKQNLSPFANILRWYRAYRQVSMCCSKLASLFSNNNFRYSWPLMAFSFSKIPLLTYLTVCQTVCYTLRSHILSLHAHILWYIIRAYTLLPDLYTIRQLDLMPKFWNELLRHWRSGFYICGR